jgi:hypothetical protein
LRASKRISFAVCTPRGGVATVSAATRAKWLAEAEEPPFDPEPQASAGAVDAEPEGGEASEAVQEEEDERLAA